MVNERYEEEGQEEGEYHFSDDHANYDMDSGTATKDSAGVAVAPKESVAEKLKQHRRIVIGIIVFIILLGIVYQFMSPANPPVAELQPNTNAKAPPKKIEMPGTTQPSQPAPIMQPTQQAPMVQPGKEIMTAPPPPVQPSQPVMQMPTVSQPPVGMVEPPPAQTVAVTNTTTTTPTSPPPIGGTIQTEKNIPDRIAMLEQQNSAMMNLMQTQYAQKISDAELQNTQLRTQVQELNGRISSMEIAFRQLTKILRNSASPAASSNREMANVPSARVTQPRSIYTVQAIIPGRAWLKAESGETVTVAEGDMLKGYGRVIKIDPYDGVVDIDTGNRVMSLAYGLSGD